MADFRRLQHDKESEGKNKGAINKRVMRKFNQTIDALQLLELDLFGKKNHLVK
jgi:predicted secreted protein